MFFILSFAKDADVFRFSLTMAWSFQSVMRYLFQQNTLVPVDQSALTYSFEGSCRDTPK